MTLKSYLTPHTKVSSRKAKELNVKVQTIKLLEEENILLIHNLGPDTKCLDKTPKHQKQNKTKLINWTSLTLKLLCIKTQSRK